MDMNGMIRILCTAVLLCVWLGGAAQIVADADTREPLGNASVFDRNGKAIGICRANGRMPYVERGEYPVTVRYLGYEQCVVPSPGRDTIFLENTYMELPEVVVSKHTKVLHMLGYVREYSTLSTYTDTVFMFREKIVDYMIPLDPKSKWRGWRTPRPLKSRSYYRFTDVMGLDSVSDVSRHYYTWTDWVGVPAAAVVPHHLRGIEAGTDTIHGKYSPSELWRRNDDQLSVDVDVLADTASRSWVPQLNSFFRNDIEFDNFRIRYKFGAIADDSMLVRNLAAYSMNVESRGRLRKMFQFNRVDEPFFVESYAEVYITDKEYITLKEAKAWEKSPQQDFEIIGPPEAGELQQSTLDLMARVDNIDREGIRLAQVPDHRLGNNKRIRQTFLDRALAMLKDFVGYTSLKYQQNEKKSWRQFKRDRLEKNR